MANNEVRAMVHSTKTIQTVTVLEWNAMDDIIVITEAGVKCHAIWNVFTGLVYADDLYAVIEEGGERK